MGSQEVVSFGGCHFILYPYKIFSMLVRKIPMVRVLHVLAHNRFLGEYACTFVMHMVYDILVVGMVVYDMQVQCGCVLSKVPLKFMNSGTIFAIVCMDMHFQCMQWYVWA